MGRLLIISNRLPVTVAREGSRFTVTRSSGGLATGLRGPHEKLDSLWLGWPGDLSGFSASERRALDDRLAELRTAAVPLTPGEIKRYYEGFSNGVLWPLFHSMTGRIQMDMWRNWKSYFDVNRRFAEAAADRLGPGDRVWVHDYQLALVPYLLRQLVPEASIGFFLHIPFPPSDVFRILPWREEILEGLMGADLVGFHTYAYEREFARAVEVSLGAAVDGDFLHHAGRRTRVGVFPMGVDAAAFGALADSEEVRAQTDSIRREAGGRMILLGVDRLDYTKGLQRRMLAVERLLEREPSLRDAVRMIQVVVPSRTKVDSYALLRRQVDEVVGRINGAYGTVHAVPIHYLYHSISPEQLVALYRAAHVMVVTPLKDGMNLVAKEFVASRTDGDGVLVLSEFAGAAAELVGAIQVNPYDVDRLASTLRQGLTMHEKDRRARMGTLRRRVTHFDSYRWADMFLQALAESRGTAQSGEVEISSAVDIATLARTLARAPQRLLLLDYDGTLVPFANAPELAAPDPELVELLTSLAQSPGTVLHLISGRPRETLDMWFGSHPLGLHAEHGLWSRPSRGSPWEPLHSDSPAWKRAVLDLLDRFVDQIPGSLVEDKTAALTWHYRMADPELVERTHGEMIRALRKELDGTNAEILEGHKIIEVRPRGVNKGVVASRLLEAGDQERAVLAMGDDRTDEDLFAALPPGSFSVHVGPGPSIARFRIPDFSAARAFLRRLKQ